MHNNNDKTVRPGGSSRLLAIQQLAPISATRVKRFSLRQPTKLKDAVLHLLSAVVAVALIGCAGGPQPVGSIGGEITPTGTNLVGSIALPISSNITAEVNGAVNPVTGEWSGGFQIVFKNVVAPEIAEQMQAAGGQPMNDGVAFAFPGVKSPSNPNYYKAITIAAGVGDYTVTALK